MYFWIINLKLDLSQVPTDVDIRVMLTFLELYQTLLSFVLFKIFTDAGLIYPPPLDAKKDNDGAGIDALVLQDCSRQILPASITSAAGCQITGKTVRQMIKTIDVSSESNIPDVEMSNAEPTTMDPEEEFVPQRSASDKAAQPALPTLQSISTLPRTLSVSLFAPYTFFLSRETPRPIFEFIVRSFGGRIGWPPSSGSCSSIDENDPTITHVIVDRPVVAKQETPDQRELRLRRKYVQPQWIVDCINAGKILLEESYAQGKPLPPHFSPFGEYEGAYIPHDEPSHEEQIEANEEDGTEENGEEEAGEALDEIFTASHDPASLRAAELAAEAAGVDYGAFEDSVKKTSKKQAKIMKVDLLEDAEGDMNKMMMSNKQRKLYEKMKYSNKKKETEV